MPTGDPICAVHGMVPCRCNDSLFGVGPFSAADRLTDLRVVFNRLLDDLTAEQQEQILREATELARKVRGP
jgi:hypothetical protein